MNRGFTLLWRKIWKNPVLHERGRSFSKREAWLYITNELAAGMNKPEDDLLRGEFRASYRYLARAWGWDVAKTFRFMSSLAQAAMISEVKREVKHQVKQETKHFSVCNYEIYNPLRNTIRNTDRNTQRNKIKEGFKEGSKEGEITTSQPAGAGAVDPLPSVEAYRLSELLRKAIAVRDPNAKAAKLPDTTRWARDIDKLIRIDGRRAEDIEVVIGWCQNPGCFWGPNILSGRSLREKFDNMWGQMKRKRNGGKPIASSLFDHPAGAAGAPGSTSEARTSRGERHYIPRQQ